jgi:DNA-binding CsgD family transcriptional regulator
VSDAVRDVPKARQPRKRAELVGRLTPMEETVVELIGEGLTRAEVCKALGIAAGTLDVHALNAARKIPGTLPTIVRIAVWWRRGSLAVLHAYRMPTANWTCPCPKCRTARRNGAVKVPMNTFTDED